MGRAPRVTTALVGAIAGSLAACAGSGEAPQATVWTLAEIPSITIGALKGEPSQLFQSIVDAELLPDRRVMVVDGGLSVIRVFDSAGDAVAEMGREGDGPGEFRDLRDAWVLGADTIVAWDSGLRRLSYFTRTGALGRTVTVEGSDEARGVGRLDLAVGPLDGGVVALAALGMGEWGRVSADRVSVELFGSDGRHLGRAGEGTGLVRFPVGERGSAPIPFTPFPRFDTRGSSVYFTNGGEPRVVIWSNGSERVLALPTVRHDVEAAWSGLSDRLLSEGSGDFTDVLREAPRPDSIPHLSGLLVDDAGRIWIKPYEPMADALWLNDRGSRRASWWVVDESGAPIADVTVPAGFEPLDVRGDMVLGLMVDPFGVERIQVHVLDRSGSEER